MISAKGLGAVGSTGGLAAEAALAGAVGTGAVTAGPGATGPGGGMGVGTGGSTGFEVWPLAGTTRDAVAGSIAGVATGAVAAATTTGAEVDGVAAVDSAVPLVGLAPSCERMSMPAQALSISRLAIIQMDRVTRCDAGGSDGAADGAAGDAEISTNEEAERPENGFMACGTVQNPNDTCFYGEIMKDPSVPSPNRSNLYLSIYIANYLYNTQATAIFYQLFAQNRGFDAQYTHYGYKKIKTGFVAASSKHGGRAVLQRSATRSGGAVWRA